MTDKRLYAVWRKHVAPAFVLSVVPLLAVATSAANGLALGFSFLLTLVIAGACTAVIGARAPTPVRTAMFVLIAASIVSALELGMNAYVHGIYSALGIYLPLVTGSCAIAGYLGGIAAEHDPYKALLGTLATGAAAGAVLIVVGGLRELIATGLPLAALPPGAFIGLALLLALKNILVRE
jgi:Na+-translocating ferredoxin:NAD+ oxidoreductase subunit E